MASGLTNADDRRRPRLGGWRGLAAVLAGVALVASAVAATAAFASSPRREHPVPIPAGATLLPSGRYVKPAGKTYNLGDFSLGLAVSPSGNCAVSTNEGWGQGQALTKAGHHPDEGLSVVNLATEAVANVTAGPSPNQFGIGLAFNRDGSRLFVTSGGKDSVYEFSANPSTCALSLVQTLQLPQHPLSGFFAGKTAGYDRGLAVTPDDAQVLVTSEYNRELDIVNVGAGGRMSLGSKVSFATPAITPHATNAFNATGATNDTDPSYLYAVAVGTNPATGHPRAYISSEGTSQVVIAESDGAQNWAKGAIVAVGDHPTGLAVSPDSRTLMVADANSDQISIVTVRGDGTLAPANNVALHSRAKEATGSAPDAVAFDGANRAYVALAGDNAVAVLDNARHGWLVSGMVPTGWYTSAVAVNPKDHSVLAVAAKGLGSRYPAGGVYPIPAAAAAGGSPAVLPSHDYQDKDNMPSLLNKFYVAPHRAAGAATTERLAQDTERVSAAILYPGTAVLRSPHNPVPDASSAGQSPIKHVVYIVRENRTFDQEYGDLKTTRSDVNAEPAYQELAASTPQGHAITNRFALSDNFFSDGEASVQGHWWTSSANVSDWIEKGWRLNYSNRNRGQDFLAPVAMPENCSLFQDAAARAAASGGKFTMRDYGEFYGATTIDATGFPIASPCNPFLGPYTGPKYAGPTYTDTGTVFPGASAGTVNLLQSAGHFPVYDYGDIRYPNALNGDANLSVDDRLGAAEFLNDIGINDDGSAKTPANGFGLANFNYMVMPEDHTTGLSATFTPRAEVAQNDAAVGKVISALSKSSYWSSTAVIVVEDDSQDGIDHVDGHRNVLLVASPYVKHVAKDTCLPGYVSHVRYDQASVIRTMELLLGMKTLSAYDQNASPLYEMFQDKNSAEQLTSADLAPFTPVPDPPFINETVASLPTTPANTAIKAASKVMPAGQDKAGPILEDILWRTATDRPVPAPLLDELHKAQTADANGENDAAGPGVATTSDAGDTADRNNSQPSRPSSPAKCRSTPSDDD